MPAAIWVAALIAAGVVVCALLLVVMIRWLTLVIETMQRGCRPRGLLILPQHSELPPCVFTREEN